MDSRCTFLAAVAATALVCVSARAVNISNTWMLPEEGFPVFYRYFRDRISWYEADAVCQFHHANLVTVVYMPGEVLVEDGGQVFREMAPGVVEERRRFCPSFPLGLLITYGGECAQGDELRQDIVFSKVGGMLAKAWLEYRFYRPRDGVSKKNYCVDSTSQFDAMRAYLKELDIASNVWIGLSKNSEKARFMWTDFRPLSNDGHWQEAIPVGSNPLCAATDPAADFRWHALQCGGPEVASFICELPVPTWATGSGGCLLTELPSLTVLYVPEQSALELTSDCGLDGTKRIACKGNADRDEMMRQLSCSITNDDYDDKATKGPIPASTIAEITNPSVSQSIKTTKPWIWTSNTIDTGDYGAATRHRRETENTLGPISSTSGTTDIAMNEKIITHQEATTNPSVFPKEINLRGKLLSESTTLSTLNDVTLDLSVTQKSDKSQEITATPIHESTTQEPSSQPEEQAETFGIATPTVDVKNIDLVQEDAGEYPGVINQGQLFSIIENGTMFDIIELNETGTEETNIAKESTLTTHQDTKKIVTLTESTTSPTQTVKTLYTTVIYHKEPPEDLIRTKEKHEEEKQTKQEVTPIFKNYESKTPFNDKNSNKQKTLNDLQTKDDDKILTKEVEMFPIISDSSIKLNRTYRKKLPMFESNFTKENEDMSMQTDDVSVTQQATVDSDADDFIIADEKSKHKIIEIKLHKDDDKNLTRTKLFITTRIPDKNKREGKNAKIVKNDDVQNATDKDSIEKFDEPSNSTDMETEVKEAEIDPKLDNLNAKIGNSLRNNDSEIIPPITSKEKNLKQQSLPKPFVEEPAMPNENDSKMQEVVVEEPLESLGTAINTTGEPLEPIPQQQPRPNRQRLLTKPQRRSFYPYFFSRVLG